MQRPADSLTEEFSAMNRLHELLQSEHKALIEGAVDSLPELIRAKGYLISEITVMADGRHQSLVAIDMEASEDSMQRWVDATANDAEKQQWSALLALALEVKELNRLNGVVINKHAQTNQQMMGLFSGMVGNSFYGPNGQSSIKAHTRKFGAA